MDKKKLPIYKAVLEYEDDGMVAISLVDSPATEVDWMAFAEDKPSIKFAVENEDKHIVKGVLMSANTPIYRIGVSGYEYYIEFDPETLREIAQRYLMNGFQNNVDTMHNHQLEDGIWMQEIYLKDAENGINPKGFEDVADGSLFGQFKVENEEVWQKIKDGTFKGFSIEIFAGTELVQDPEEEEYAEILKLINEIKNKVNG